VLPLLPDKVLIAISPAQLSMVRLSGWLSNKKVVAKHSTNLSLPKMNEVNWQPVIDALGAVLKEAQWQRAKTKIVISNSMVRYTLLPWSDTILNAEEERKFAQHKINQVFGGNFKNWEIILGANVYGNSRLACAVDTVLLSQLRQLALKSQLTIQSIQPHLIAALSYWQKRLSGKQQQFVLFDGEKLCIAYIENGQLKNLRMEQMNGTLNNTAFDDMVMSSLQREAMINDEISEPESIFLFVPNQAQAGSSSASSNKFERLRLPINYMENPAAFLAAASLN
jgi:hypothetical protein